MQNTNTLRWTLIRIFTINLSSMDYNYCSLSLTIDLNIFINKINIKTSLGTKRVVKKSSLQCFFFRWWFESKSYNGIILQVENSHLFIERSEKFSRVHCLTWMKTATSTTFILHCVACALFIVFQQNDDNVFVKLHRDAV